MVPGTQVSACVTVPVNLPICSICRLCSKAAQSGDHGLDEKCNVQRLQIREALLCKQQKPAQYIRLYDLSLGHEDNGLVGTLCR